MIILSATVEEENAQDCSITMIDDQMCDDQNIILYCFDKLRMPPGFVRTMHIERTTVGDDEYQLILPQSVFVFPNLTSCQVRML